MEKKTVFVKDVLLTELTDELQRVAAVLKDAGEGFKTLFPSIAWKNETVQALVFDPLAGEINQFLYCDLIRRKADENSVSVGFIADSGVRPGNDQEKANYNFIQFQIGGNWRKIQALRDQKNARSLQTFLRTGALTIDAYGLAVVAKDAANRLKDYCSVTVENDQEKAYYDKAVALQKAANAIKTMRDELADAAATPAARKDILTDRRDIEKLRLSEEIRLTSVSAIWRGLITHVLIYRKNDAPHFFNDQGKTLLSLAEIYNLLGFKPRASAGLRIACPDLYDGVAFENVWPYTAEYFKEYKQELEHKKKKGYIIEIDQQRGTVEVTTAFQKSSTFNTDKRLAKARSSFSGYTDIEGHAADYYD